jgi:RNA polymerase sigma-70 factor, ECF subfamily
MPQSEPAQAEIMRLFTGHQVQLRAYAYAICRDAHLTEDIVQEVAVVLITKYSDYDVTRPFLPWAMGITRNKAFEMLRERGKHVMALDEEALDRLESSLAATGTPEYVEARLDAMLSCMKRVGEQGQEVLNMKYVRRMSAREIAEATRRNVAAVNSLLQRLRARVVECVDRRMAEVAR